MNRSRLFGFALFLVACGASPASSLPAALTENAPASSTSAPAAEPTSTSSSSADASASASAAADFGLDHTDDVCRGGPNPTPPPSKTPRKTSIKPGQLQVNGRVPPDVIAAIVNTGKEQFKSCYEAGLNANAKLAGRVGVLFVIGPDGKVALARLDQSQSTLGDSDVSMCIARSFCALSFPAPSSGIVTVAYPMTLSSVR